MGRGLDRGEGRLTVEPVAAPARATTRAPSSVALSARRAANRWGWRLFVGAVVITLFGPIVILVLFAFNDSNVLAFPLEGFTLVWFGQAFDDTLLRKALVNSFVVACVVAPVCCVLGTLAAFGLTRFRFRFRGAVAGLVGAPLVLPWLIIGIAALMGYARLDVELSRTTVIATQTVCTFPLVAAIVSASLFRFERVQEEAAIDLGCSRMQVLRYVVLPHVAPALGAAAIFAFTWSFNNYEISLFTIGFDQTFPIWVYSSVRNPDHTAVVNAISTLISAGQIVLIVLGVRLLRRGGGATAMIGAELPETARSR